MENLGIDIDLKISDQDAAKIGIVILIAVFFGALGASLVTK